MGRRGIAATLALLLLGCGGEAVVRPRTNVAPRRPADAPLSVAANRNALPPEPVDSDDEHARLVLWCSQPGGAACSAAQEELGLVPTPTPAVPGTFLSGGRDLEDDCTDPDLAPLLERIGQALGIAPDRWLDQEGQILDPERIADLYSGGGCTNVSRTHEPPVKVHVVQLEGAAHFLVRVWEIGEVQ